MRRLTLAVAGAALGLLGLQFSATANITPAPQQRLLNSPLAAYPGFGHNTEADEARFDRESLAREHMTAACMKQAGFPYTVATPVKDSAEAQDPNISYAESLSAERRTEYYLALYGVENPNSPLADDLYDRNAPGGGGCSGAAFAKLPGVFKAAGILTEQYIKLRASIPQDSRVVAAEQKWSACMQSRGYIYATTQALRAELDNAVANGTYSERLEQQNRQAVEVGRTCGTKVGLENTIAEVRVEKETAFVAEHKALLDQHLERVRSEEVIINQALNGK